MIVIDVGCARYGGDYSIERLIEEFHPDYLYGFDPHPSVEEGEQEIDGTRVSLSRSAAWTCDGELGYVEDGLNSWVTERPEEPRVPCFDLAVFIRSLPDDDIILKIDAEGAEYDILEHLIKTRTDELLSLAWVEFHKDPEGRRQWIEEEIACELTEWNW